jgi:hypothetical protein
VPRLHMPHLVQAVRSLYSYAATKPPSEEEGPEPKALADLGRAWLKGLAALDQPALEHALSREDSNAISRVSVRDPEFTRSYERFTQQLAESSWQRLPDGVAPTIGQGGGLIPEPVPSERSAEGPAPKTSDEWAYEQFCAFEALCGNADRIAERLEEARSYEPKTLRPSTSGEQAQPPLAHRSTRREGDTRRSTCAGGSTAN